MASIVFYTTGEDWAAWYLDGKLQDDGHEHNMLEQVFQEVGVEHRVSSEFLRGTAGRQTEAAPTVTEAEAYGTKLAAKEAQRRDDLARAATLLESANEAYAEAARLQARHR
jgi:hypothetical protein